MQSRYWLHSQRLAIALLCFGAGHLNAQSASQPHAFNGRQASVPAPAGNTQVADPLAQLTPEQRSKSDEALQLFKTERYADALVIFKQLLPQFSAGAPVQLLLAKFASESALNAGDTEFASSLLKPIEAAVANDWQATSLLARVSAESAQKQLRDVELSHLIDLHKRAVSPQIAGMQQVLERIPIKGGSIRVWYSLEPWGPYNTYVFARVYDQSGQQVLRISLESSDFDQPLFAKEHHELAAQGRRRFSLDDYGQDQRLANNQVNQSHSTISFYDGQPSYDIVRERMVQTAETEIKRPNKP